MQKQLLYFIILFFSHQVFANTIVYFFQHKLPNGEVYSFDRNGRFYHSALKYKTKILEAHPYYGVRLATDLKKVGDLAAVLKSEKNILNLDAKIKMQMGKKFNLYSAWDDPLTTQCSKLIGQIIGVSPVIVQDGNLSLSPDLLYAELIKLGFVSQAF